MAGAAARQRPLRQRGLAERPRRVDRGPPPSGDGSRHRPADGGRLGLPAPVERQRLLPDQGQPPVRPRAEGPRDARVLRGRRQPRVSATAPVPADWVGRWHQLAGVYDGSEIRLRRGRQGRRGAALQRHARPHADADQRRPHGRHPRPGAPRPDQQRGLRPRAASSLARSRSPTSNVRPPSSRARPRCGSSSTRS